jgi:hypothetical protein
MIPSSCSVARKESKLMRLGFLGLTIKEKNSKERLIAKELNGLIHKTSILLFG